MEWTTISKKFESDYLIQYRNEAIKDLLKFDLKQYEAELYLLLPLNILKDFKLAERIVKHQMDKKVRQLISRILFPRKNKALNSLVEM